MTQQDIENKFLTKSQVLKAYLLGNEDKLFLLDEHDHIKNVFKSNKKDMRMSLYRINYFIVVACLLIGLLLIIKSTKASILLIILGFIFSLKPLVHLFALENKRNKMNIYLYKKSCPEGHFPKLTEESIASSETAGKSTGFLKKLGIGILALFIISTVASFFIKGKNVEKIVETTISNSSITNSKTEKQATKEPEKKVENKNITPVQTYEKTSDIGKVGYINGTDIIMREGYSSQYKIIGSFKKSGEKVAILDKYISKKTTILIKKKITVTDRDDKEHVLEKGKSIEIVAVNPEVDDEILISFKDKNGKRKEGMVYSKTDLDYIKTYWYKVKRNSGEIGWVFGKFITIQ
ncbi:hypothetical protein G1K66_01310 [Tenacibaculum finnmarkense]|uniref:hypothetical protein n=1 Tax=Tenacibaculum finnmarkense TaxID=2781243 RepID=UPI00187B46F9|nr:hypothetical protein [Tenacibaculum finnmarkense]MBE7644635.1 hypothetical protein [Tenacibaculum finnmarkense genomovar ulcerans]MCD8401240.1 hypothetical protein [Tenacibaculum finnmarkense genomovar ulcerans]MCD8409730.1 hypothetical protein [Tenacibaculum finnmarkense genomovar ulcerans]MCG8732643.1 hypothetical protein [Tenacibaculum finnmarkense]MCG8762379.1 hypothetical protein [Tenacibaculum finnmarkense]